MSPATLSKAAEALDAALARLDASLGPVLSEVAQLRNAARETQGLAEDRTRLAAQLDDALEAARLKEAEFDRLSKQTREELDATIQTLQQALSSKGGARNG
ncbi:MAG: DUF4164 family protein [Litorimonas sp.]